MDAHIRVDRRFAIIDEWVLDLEVSDRALRLYAILLRYADKDTHKAFPSRRTLADRLRCSPKSVDRAIAELIENRLLTKEQRFNSSLVFTLSTGVDSGVQGGWSPMSRGVDTGDDLTITTKREPKEREPLIEKRTKKTADDYEPSERITEGFDDQYPGLRLDVELEKFRDHHMAVGSDFKDWDRAFRKWLRNALQWSPEARKMKAQTVSDEEWEAFKRENGLD